MNPDLPGLMLAWLPIAIGILVLALLVIHAMQSKRPTYSDAIRSTQYAGTWYESDAAKLRAQISAFLTNAEEHVAPAQSDVMAIIAPHAGYMYSAKTAAFGYEQAAKSQSIKRVFVLGPSHHMALHGAALSNATIFQTPLADLQVDQETVAELASYPLFSVRPDIHQIEHSLEMQLPFIQQSFGDVAIIPIIIGVLQDESEVRLIAEILKGYVKKGDLLVVSSDFTHYGPRYDFAPFQKPFQAKVEELDREAFAHLSRMDVQGFMDFQRRTDDTICGLYPCAVLCAMLPHDAQAALLKYATSQDVIVEDSDNAVSYLSISFQGPGWPANPDERKTAEEAVQLSEADKIALLSLAKDAIVTYAKDGSVIEVDNGGAALSPSLKRCFGAFVTLYKTSATSTRNRHPGKELRGCIGNIWPVKPLSQSVIDNAISASSRDYRFDPLQPHELDQIHIEISVLTPPRRVASYKDIAIGTDGIILSKNNKQSVFLPKVPIEFGWDLEETLRQLCVKAGLDESDWQNDAKFDTFQSISIEESSTVI